jgi:hypothetical protein
MYLLVFHAYINVMRGSRSKIPTKNLIRQRCAEGLISGVHRLSGSMLEKHGFIKELNCLFISGRNLLRWTFK